MISSGKPVGAGIGVHVLARTSGQRDRRVGRAGDRLGSRAGKRPLLELIGTDGGTGYGGSVASE